MSNLLNISSVDGRYQQKTKQLNPYFSEYGLIYYRYFIEIEWFKKLASENSITEITNLSDSSIKFLNELQKNFNLEKAQQIKDIERITNHDVKAVEYQLKEDFKGIAELEKNSEFLHFACTSEDINNTSYGLMLKDGRENVLLPDIKSVTTKLLEIAKDLKNQPMLARTHGQTASPTTVGKEFANVFVRLDRQLKQFANIEILAKMNGAVGNFNAHISAYPNVDWQKFSKEIITENLGLNFNAYTTQIEPHDYIAEYCHCLIRINTIMLDLNRDIWSYISLGYFKQKVISGEIGSSTMPHKVNPIDFENSEGNLGIANALLQHLATKLPVSRMQRDLTDSTVLRTMGTAFGHCVISYSSLLKGLNKLEINEIKLNQDLDDSWEVLAEPIQTVMRRYKVLNAYEQLKEFTRGKQINSKNIKEFIDSLDIPNSAKKELTELTPDKYIGLAKELAENI